MSGSRRLKCMWQTAILAITVTTGALVGLPMQAATIGIVPLGTETISAADLRTATLSTFTNVAVVERSQLHKVIQWTFLSNVFSVQSACLFKIPAKSAANIAW